MMPSTTSVSLGPRTLLTTSSVVHPSTLSPLTVISSSPARSPAFAAGLLGIGVRMKVSSRAFTSAPTPW